MNFVKTVLVAITPFAQAVMTNLLSSFISFVFLFLFLRKKRIVISRVIARSVNKSRYTEGGEVAWKFKIINKSMFMEFYNFDVSLVGIKYVENSDGTISEHRKKIDCVCGMKFLSRYIPGWLLRIKRKINPNYIVNFIYRPLTYENLDNYLRERKYDALELAVTCTDSLSGFTHISKELFKSTPIVEGDFTTDGKRDAVKFKRVPDIAWINHENETKKKQITISQEETK